MACKHLEPPFPGVIPGVKTAKVGVFVCPWCEVDRLQKIEKAATLLRFSAERDNWPVRSHGRFKSLCAALDGREYDEDADEGPCPECGADGMPHESHCPM